MEHLLPGTEANICRKIISFTSKGNSDIFHVKLYWSVRQLKGREQRQPSPPPPAPSTRRKGLESYGWLNRYLEVNENLQHMQRKVKGKLTGLLIWMLSAKRKDSPQDRLKRETKYPCQKEEVGWRALLERIQLKCLVQGSQTRHSREQESSSGSPGSPANKRFRAKMQALVLEEPFCNMTLRKRALNLANTGISAPSVSNTYRSTSTLFRVANRHWKAAALKGPEISARAYRIHWSTEGEGTKRKFP